MTEFTIFVIAVLIITVLGVLTGLYFIKNPQAGCKTKKINDMTYSEFSLYLLDYDIEPYLYHGDYEIYLIDDHYYYYKYDLEGLCNCFYELYLIAKLEHDVCSIPLYDQDTDLIRLFFCDCCCKTRTDDDTDCYYWFRRVGEKHV